MMQRVSEMIGPFTRNVSKNNVAHDHLPGPAGVAANPLQMRRQMDTERCSLPAHAADIDFQIKFGKSSGSLRGAIQSRFRRITFLRP